MAEKLKKEWYIIRRRVTFLGSVLVADSKKQLSDGEVTVELLRGHEVVKWVPAAHPLDQSS